MTCTPRLRIAALAALTLTALALPGVALPGVARADLVVNESLGALSFGTTTLANTTAGQANNASYYSNVGSRLVWDSEYVYSFTLSAPTRLSVAAQNNAVDTDFFILNSLATSADSNGERFANGLFNSVDVTGTFGIFNPGTY